MTTTENDQQRFKLTRTTWKKRTVLSTARTIKINGWGKFLDWINAGNICLITSRITQGGGGHDNAENHPPLAAAIPTQWIERLGRRDDLIHATTRAVISHEARRDLKPLCMKVYTEAAEGRNIHYRVDLYSRSGKRSHTDQGVAPDRAFTLVSIPWLAETLQVTETELEAIDRRLPWTDTLPE